jgi:hypothetical protein
LVDASVSAVAQQPVYLGPAPTLAARGGVAFGLQFFGQLLTGQAARVGALKSVADSFYFPGIVAGQQSNSVALASLFPAAESPNKPAGGVEFPAVHPVGREARGPIAGFDGGNAAPDRLGRQLGKVVVARLLVDEKKQLLCEVLQVNRALATGMQGHLCLAQLVVEHNRVHRLFAADAVRMPRKKYGELAGLCACQQRGQAGALIGGAVSGNCFIAEPFDNSATFPCRQLDDFRALLRGRLVLLPAGHSDVGRGIRLCIASARSCFHWAPY